MYGLLVGKCNDSEVSSINLWSHRPESYPIAIHLHLFFVGVLDHTNAHLFGKVWALCKNLVLEVFSEGVVHESLFVFRTSAMCHGGKWRGSCVSRNRDIYRSWHHRLVELSRSRGVWNVDT